MEDVLRIAFGPTLSLLFFFIGYRRTVGARKERARAAELEIERLMVRRVIVDGYKPTTNDLARLIARKARQHRVKVSDLPTESQFLTAVYTEILENEFVAHSEREALLQRIDSVIRSRDVQDDPDEHLDVAVDAAIDSADRAAADQQRRRAVIAMAALATVLGTTVTAASTLAEFGTSDRTIVLPLVGLASAVVVTLAAFAVRVRERLEEDVTLPAATGVSFESKVEDAIRRAGLDPSLGADLYSTVDFVVRTPSRSVGIDVKYVHNPTSEYVRMMLRRAQESVKDFDELILVIPTVPPALREWGRGGMRVVDLRGLRSYLERLSKDVESDGGAQASSRALN